MSNPSERINLLYEIAMSISEGPDLATMAKRTLQTIIKRMSCPAGAIYTLRTDSKGDSFQDLAVIPRNITKNKTYMTALAHIASIDPKTITDGSLKGLPLHKSPEADSHFYIMGLPFFGLILLLKNEKSLPFDLLQDLLPLNQKFAETCNGWLSKKLLQKSEQRYRQLTDNAPYMIYRMTLPDGVYKYVNPAAEKIFGYSPQEFYDTPFLIKKAIHPDWSDYFKKQWALLLSGEMPPFYEYQIINKLGETLWLLQRNVLVKSDSGKPIAIEGIVSDITERKRIEKKKMEVQLQQTQKMEAIATLAGGVAHEFNNALMGIMGNIELLKMELPEDERKTKYLEAMKGSGHRMSRLTDQLLAYAEGGKYQPKDLKMDDFVIETLPILQHDLNPTVRVETHFPKDISYISADYTQMQMVLSAILSNSNEAIEDEGIIRITAENKDLDEDFTKQHPGIKPGLYVSLTIEDNGKGMDEETRKGIFEPFFTTKFQGRGMGMAAAYGIVRNHDGWISVDSELRKGTAVQIYLPAIGVEVEKPKKAKTDVTTRTGTILMIEDEEVVIEVTQAMLEMLGYRVMVAKTGKDAIHIAETFDGQIDLALLDIKLPDIDGRNLYPLIMKARSNLKVIVFSGYSIDGPAREILDAGAQDFIQKPFSLTTLSEKLKEVFEAK